MTVNKYKSIEDAANAWYNDPHWREVAQMFSGPYWAWTECAAICTENNKTFFIITHPECVSYRFAIGQVVAFLTCETRKPVAEELLSMPISLN